MLSIPLILWSLHLFCNMWHKWWREVPIWLLQKLCPSFFVSTNFSILSNVHIEEAFKNNNLQEVKVTIERLKFFLNVFCNTNCCLCLCQGNKWGKWIAWTLKRFLCLHMSLHCCEKIDASLCQKPRHFMSFWKKVIILLDSWSQQLFLENEMVHDIHNGQTSCCDLVVPQKLWGLEEQCKK